MEVGVHPPVGGRKVVLLDFTLGRKDRLCGSVPSTCLGLDGFHWAKGLPAEATYSGNPGL